MGEPQMYGIDMSEDVKGTIESILAEAGLVLKDMVLCGQKSRIGKGKPFLAIAVAEKS